MTGLFVDTNILVYSRDRSEKKKQLHAFQCLERLWKSRRGRIGVQVLNEYYVTVTQKLKPGLPAHEAWEDVESFKAWEPVSMNMDLLNLGRVLQNRFRLSWWDALIVSAAKISQCSVILTEDMQDGQDFDGTVVVNPFRKTLEEIFS